MEKRGGEEGKWIYEPQGEKKVKPKNIRLQRRLEHKGNSGREYCHQHKLLSSLATHSYLYTLFVLAGLHMVT